VVDQGRDVTTIADGTVRWDHEVARGRVGAEDVGGLLVSFRILLLLLLLRSSEVEIDQSVLSMLITLSPFLSFKSKGKIESFTLQSTGVEEPL